MAFLVILSPPVAVLGTRRSSGGRGPSKSVAPPGELSREADENFDPDVRELVPGEGEDVRSESEDWKRENTVSWRFALCAWG